MKEILLIIALVIAIFSDIVRIHQYRAMNKKNRKKAIKEIATKVARMFGEWASSKETIEFEDYAVEHWEDEE